MSQATNPSDGDRGEEPDSLYEKYREEVDDLADRDDEIGALARAVRRLDEQEEADAE